jgi:hypothetical protein
MKGRSSILLAVMILVVGLLASTGMAWADRARAPYDYVTEVGNGKYLFVMLATQSHGLDAGAPDDVGIIETDSSLRKRYKESGLYLPGRKEPLWTVSWYSFEIYPASDGDHLVRLGPWASSVDQLALAFYSRGSEVKHYLIRDLIKNFTRVRPTVSHFFWMESHHFDDTGQVFHLKTVEGQSYRFSITNGELLKE